MRTVRVSSSTANHDYESNEINDAFLLQTKIGIEYSPILDEPLFPVPIFLDPGAGRHSP